MRALAFTAALALLVPLAPAQADDPADPAMRSRAARERDRQQIRALNLAQLAHVRQRDAAYAQEWAAWKARGTGGASRMAANDAVTGDPSADEDYAKARARHARDLARWREQVAACQNGDYAACER